MGTNTRIGEICAAMSDSFHGIIGGRVCERHGGIRERYSYHCAVFSCFDNFPARLHLRWGLRVRMESSRTAVGLAENPLSVLVCVPLIMYFDEPPQGLF